MTSQDPKGTPTPKKKKLKQGSLFSFFGKKNAAASTPAPSSSQKPETPSSATGASSNKTKTKGQELWRKLSVGDRISVYWEDDAKFYDAKVTGQHRQNKTMFTLTYDDGEVETVDITTQQFRMLGDARDQPKTSEKRTIEAPRTGTNSSKRRRVLEDTDEESDEPEAQDESDGSVYEDKMDEDGDEEEEEAHWMVTDDEIENSPVAAKSKKRLKRKYKVTSIEKPKTTPAPKQEGSQFSKVSAPSTPSPQKENTATKPVSGTRKAPSSVTPNQRKKVTPSPVPPAVTDKAGPLPFVKDVVNPAGSHVHNHLKFLQNPKDAKRRPRGHPDYDSHTLLVDYHELERYQKPTNAVKQWWELKAQYFDAVLFFKTGKFYEMFHMDADIGVNVLNFTYMKGHVAHSGFPEISYGVMADKLVRAGYKVARVEQTETPDMLKERKKKRRKGEPLPQVVNREVCSILTLGTRTFCYLDETKGLIDESNSSTSVGPLLAIREVMLDANDNIGDENLSQQPSAICEYGITVIDAARGTITVGQFADDVLRSRMDTLLTAFEPAEVILEGGEDGASPTLVSLIRSVQASSQCEARIELIKQVESFPKSTAIDAEIRRKLERKTGVVKPWDVNETIEEIHRREYFPKSSRQKISQSVGRWPKVLKAVIEGEATLAMSSFGAALYYLQRNLIDQEIMSMGIVKAYVPPSSSTAATTDADSLLHLQNDDAIQLESVPALTPKAPEATDNPSVAFESSNHPQPEEETISHMALDGTTLHNLEVLTNSKTHTTAGSLWSRINCTKTPHGSRMLRAWLLRPLFRKADIERRADAVEELVSGAAAVALDEARSILSKCGDIERLLTRVHSMGGCGSTDGTIASDAGKVHPNDRAILYEAATHTKRKVGDFSKLLNGLRHASRIPKVFEGLQIKSGLLRKIVRSVEGSGRFPDMVEDLGWFFSNFDCEKAANGLFEPSRGVDDAFDDACDAIACIHEELEAYREEMCSGVLRPSSTARAKWKYTNTKDDSKDKFLIELPADVRVPDDFIVKGKRGKGTKQVNKYSTPVVRELVHQLERSIDVQKEGKARGMQMIFTKFDSKRNLWAAAAQATAMLDALGSLAQASSNQSFTRPEILDCHPDGNPFIRVIQGMHPCVEVTHNGGEFIPNDLTLGEEGVDGDIKRVLLLSGPNMGGKSTLLRQTCLIAILAQIGCFVPAKECSLTPIDRVFTRLGASDRILLGQSTFFVELAETASALRGASRRSLVIMDELGRGTSTFDGTAIASACVKHLIHNNKCLTLFSTHYHSLLKEWMQESCVRLGHMQCYVEGGVQEDGSKPNEEHNITFLYTLGDGACPASFGINVAKLAGLPNEVLENAKGKSTAFEQEMCDAASENVQNEAETALQSAMDAVDTNNLDALTELWESLQ